MKPSFPIFLALSALSMATSAYAVPVKGPKCAPQAHVQSVPNGSGVFLDETCQVGYVLPPQTGDLSLAGMAPNENLQRCATLSNSMLAGAAISRRLKALAEEVAPSTANDSSGSGIGSGGTLFNSASAATAPVNTVDEDAKLTELTKILEMQTKVDALLQPYAKVEGATAQILFQMDQQKLVAEYAAKNPNISFFPLQLSGAYLSIASNKSLAVGDFNAALSIEVPGIGGLPVGSANDAGNNIFRMTPTNSADAAKIFGESLSGQVRLSMLGACPFYDPSRQALKTNVSAAEVGSYLSANVQYSYELQVARKYKASYELAELVRQIREKSTHGGFFSSSTAASMIDDHNSQSWFKLDQSSEDSRVEYDDLSKTLKADLMDRVLKQVTIATVGGQAALQDPGSPGADGAAVAADGLRKNCYHIYCQAGAVVLDILNSTFGSSSAVSSYISNNDYWASDDVSDRRMVPFYGSLSFTEKK